MKKLSKIIIAFVFILFMASAIQAKNVTIIKKANHPCCSTERLSTVKTPWGVCPSYNFWGCVNDKDCDCIPDAKDQCPVDKENYNNIDDTDGCPEELIRMVVIDKKSMAVDSDNDGVSDDRDACPFKAGSKDNKGCPLAFKKMHYYPAIVQYKPESQGYFIHTSSFKTFRNAIKEIRAIRKHTKAAVCIRRTKVAGRTWFRVYIGPFKNYHKTRRTLRRLRRRHTIPRNAPIIRGYELYK
jgi:hypothetical protein